MNTSLLKLLACSLLACCTLAMRAVPARDFVSSQSETTPAAAAAEASEHDDDADADDSDDAKAAVGRGRRSHHRSNGDSVVAVGHNATLAEDARAEEVVSVFGSSTSAGRVDDAVVSVFGNTHVTGPVGDGAVAVLGNVYVNSKVGGDVVAVIGNVELGPKADVQGQIVVVGGVLLRDPNAIVHGGVQNIFGANFGGFAWLQNWMHRCLLYGRPLAFGSSLDWAWSLALGFLALYVFLGLLFHDTVERCVETFEANPGQSFLAAILTILLTPVVFILLCVTVIGIAALPFLIFALICACIFGKAVVLASLGRRCTGTLVENPAARMAIAVLVGGLIVLLLYTIPVVGFIVFQLLGLLGLGVVMYSLLMVLRARRARDAAPAAAAMAAGPSGPSGAAFAAESPATAAPASAIDPEATAPGVAAAGTAAASAEHGTAEPPASAAAPGVNLLLTAPRAGFWIRMASLALDAILIGVLLGRTHSTDMELIVLAAYGAAMWKLKGATVGGIICSLKVVRLDGREIDWPTATVRALGCFLSLAVAGLGFIWIAIDPEKQSWHDKIAGTVVVRAPRHASLL
jgi:uncharacterized RDD family membrane protein YckC